MPRLIAATLNRELLRNWAAIVFLLWFILLSARFSVYLAQAATGQLPADVVFTLSGLKSIGFAVFVLPVSLFIALLLVMGRWNQSLESVALAASGFSPSAWLRVLWPTLLLVTLLSLVLSLFVAPYTTSLGYSLRSQASQAVVSKLWQAGRFVSLRNGQLLLFADTASADGQTLEGVFVQTAKDNVQTLLSAARARRQTGTRSGAQFVVLESGYRYDGKPGRADYRVLHFERYAVRIDTGTAKTPFKWDAVSSRKLWHSDQPAASAELQQRLSWPLSVLVLVAVGIILGRYMPGKSRYGSLMVGLLVFVLYFNLLGLARGWMVKGSLSPAVGLWWVHAVPVLLALLIDRLQARWWYRGARG